MLCNVFQWTGQPLKHPPFRLGIYTPSNTRSLYAVGRGHGSLVVRVVIEWDSQWEWELQGNGNKTLTEEWGWEGGE